MFSNPKPSPDPTPPVASSFPENHPRSVFCGSKEDHDAHKESKEVKTWRGNEIWWSKCQGWKTTHIVEVREAGTGRVVGTRKVDLRGALDTDIYPVSPANALRVEAAGKNQPPPSDDEIIFGEATYNAAPELCPYDSDRCHEHLYN